MKIFNGTHQGGWGNKINFVDDNNVLLGYSLDQCCCENADWFLSSKPETGRLEGDIDLDKVADGCVDHIYELTGWNFDKEWFQEVRCLEDGESYNSFDEGGMVIFRIEKEDKQMFIHLFNCHNGYYSHGFDFVAGDQTLRADSL